MKRLVLDALRAYPARVYLFGSSVAGTTRRSSDIDVAIDPLAPLPPRVVTNLREALEESTVPYDVDVVDLTVVPSVFREHVSCQGVLWTD